jgi:hypothetical protein
MKLWIKDAPRNKNQMVSKQLLFGGDVSSFLGLNNLIGTCLEVYGLMK